METMTEYLARKAEEQRAQWKTEYEALVVAAEKEATRLQELAARMKEIDENNARIAQENALNSPEPVITCAVCGQLTIESSAIHVINQTDRCIRKPREAKAYGILNAEQWDELTTEEKNNGYIIAGAVNVVGNKEQPDFSVSYRAHLLAGNTH